MKRKLLYISLLVGFFVFFIVVLFFALQEDKKQGNKDVLVKFTQQDLHFVSQNQIKEIFLKNTKVKTNAVVRKDSIEEIILQNPFVEGAEVYRTPSGNHVIEVTQRTPFMRVMVDGESYFLDKEGFVMPTGSKYPYRTRLYRGDITKDFAKEKLLLFQKKIDSLDFWNEIIDYVVVNQTEELTLYLKVKSAKIVFGKPEKVKEKLEKLLLFINKVGKYKGLDSYEAIDLRFDNQIVCVKK